ncbi:MAG: head decoration protein [Pyrinomonadaceae bacterium]|nr:head decoration protein [Pyrinomonadaceae bacterium]
MSLQTQNFTGQKLQPYARPCEAVTESVPFGNSLTIAKGTILGIKTADGKFYAYADANSDGTQTAKAIAMYDFTTDSSGKVTIANETNVTYDTAPVYVAGTFRTNELTGLDAAGVTDLGRLLSGTVADGVLRIG